MQNLFRYCRFNRVRMAQRTLEIGQKNIDLARKKAHFVGKNEDFHRKSFIISEIPPLKLFFCYNTLVLRGNKEAAEYEGMAFSRQKTLFSETDLQNYKACFGFGE